jgi:tetratricopeptide (TPR) repeat protein
MDRRLAALLVLPFLLALAPSPTPPPASPASLPSSVPTALPSPPPSTAPTLGPQARAHWPVQTADPKTQELIDRGVAMLYAFDTGEARVAFGQTLARDPNVALAYWGMAEADTIDINVPSSPEGERRGAAAAAQGRAHLRGASPEERVLIEAIAERYGDGTKQQKLSRYADALSAYTKTHRDDPNLLTIAAFAIYDATPAFTDANDGLIPKAREMLDELDRALALEPANIGAHHLRIHLLENADRAKDAMPDAEALSSYGYPPGESHLPHMAAHIWARIGDYGRLVADNERAAGNDRAWFALGDGPGQQYMKRYHDHVVDFVLYGLSTQGRVDEARAFAKNEDAFSQVHLALRLHDDATALALASPDLHFTRAFASARDGNVATARSERAKVRGDDATARLALIDAMLARRAGDLADAVAAYGRAYDATKDGFPGDPKDDWWVPIGEGYGAALLAAKRPAQAQAVFTAELKRFPNDPHLEWGLAAALRAQGQDDSAPLAAYRSQWKGTRDLTLADLG